MTLQGCTLCACGCMKPLESTSDDAHTPSSWRGGCDPPVRLLTDSLTAMKGIDSKAAYIFYTGDMAAHHLCTGARWFKCMYVYVRVHVDNKLQECVWEGRGERSSRFR
eukprot:21112-Eustigmatos_ZCMA.PRE.1